MIYKKIVVIGVALSFVIGINIYYQNMINKHTKEMEKILYEIRMDVTENKDINSESLKRLDDTWKNAEKEIALFVDHEEIEKAEVEMLLLKTNIETKDYDSAIEKIDKAKYIFEHIKEKGEIKIKNIF